MKDFADRAVSQSLKAPQLHDFQMLSARLVINTFLGMIDQIHIYACFFYSSS